MLPARDIVVAGVRSVVYDSAAQASQASQAGQANDEAVVFVHGNPGPSDDWETLAPAVAKLGRAIAMDLPGYGRAEHPYHFDFSVAGYAAFLGRMLDQLGVKRAHLVLHDFGGGFGLAWAAAHPDQLASVSLINTGVLPGYRWHKFAKIWQTPLLGELFQAVSSTRMLKAALNRDNPRPLPDGFVERIGSYSDWPHKRAVLELYRASRDADAQFARHIPELRKLDRPACVIWGAGDAYLPVAYAHRQREAFPRAEVHVLEGLGHWPFIDDPDAVLAHLLPFLEAQLGARAAAE